MWYQTNQTQESPETRSHKIFEITVIYLDDYQKWVTACPVRFTSYLKIAVLEPADFGASLLQYNLPTTCPHKTNKKERKKENKQQTMSSLWNQDKTIQNSANGTSKLGNEQ